MVRLAVEEQFDELTELLRANGFVIPGRTVTDKEIADYLRPFTDPIQTESFHFTRAWLQRPPELPLTSTVRSSERPALNLPAEYLMIFRVLLGSVGMRPVGRICPVHGNPDSLVARVRGAGSG
ncbi:hypothetical protein GCM10020255_070550 [Rhodococcus baikonurensis]